MSHPQRYPLRDLDMAEFLLDSPVPTKRASLPSPVKLSPTKRRILGDEGVKFRTYRCSPCLSPESQSSSESTPSTVFPPSEPCSSQPYTTTRVSRVMKGHLEPSSSSCLMEPASLDPSSQHYCGFTIFRDPDPQNNDSSVPTELAEEDDHHKENEAPLRASRCSWELPIKATMPNKLVFPRPCPLELGDKVGVSCSTLARPPPSHSAFLNAKWQLRHILAADLDNEFNADPAEC